MGSANFRVQWEMGWLRSLSRPPRLQLCRYGLNLSLHRLVMLSARSTGGRGRCGRRQLFSYEAPRVDALID